MIQPCRPIPALIRAPRRFSFNTFSGSGPVPPQLGQFINTRTGVFPWHKLHLYGVCHDSSDGERHRSLRVTHPVGFAVGDAGVVGCRPFEKQAPIVIVFRAGQEFSPLRATLGAIRRGAQPRGLRAQRGVAEGRAGRIDRLMRRSSRTTRPPSWSIRTGASALSRKFRNSITSGYLTRVSILRLKRIKPHGRSARMNSRSATPSSNPDTPRD